MMKKLTRKFFHITTSFVSRIQHVHSKAAQVTLFHWVMQEYSNLREMQYSSPTVANNDNLPVSGKTQLCHAPIFGIAGRFGNLLQTDFRGSKAFGNDPPLL